MKILFQAILFIFLIFNVNQSYALPNCQGDYWNNCVGSYTYDDGDKYVGEWKDNEIHGQGTYSYADGEEYVGEFKNSKRHGQGTYSYANGGKYVGEYKNNKRHGQGTFTSASGNKYVGEYKDDKMHGQGTYSYADGEEYVGEFKDDKFHGEGIVRFPDGTKKEGIWQNDNFVKSKKIKHINQVETEKNQKQIDSEKKRQKALKEIESKKITLGMGSGFWFNHMGYFATNNHVIEGCENTQVKINNELVDAKIISFDKINDLAIGKVNKEVKSIFPLSNKPQLGEEVMVGGFPLSKVLKNDSIKITRGIVSSLSGVNNNYTMIQIDAPIQMGNSGGPIINSYGEVVGIATSYLKSTKDYDTQNVNFGVKSNLLINMSESLGVKVTTKVKLKNKNSTELAKVLESNTLHIHCTNTLKQWVALQEKEGVSSQLSEFININLKDFIQ